MSKCLITRLKASVNDASIEKFGELVLNVANVSNEANPWVRFDPVADTEVVLEGGTWIDGSAINLIKAGDVYGKRLVANVDGGAIKIKITNKYNISVIASSFGSDATTTPIKASALAYCPLVDRMWSDVSPKFEILWDEEMSTKKIISKSVFAEINLTKSASGLNIDWLNGLSHFTKVILRNPLCKGDIVSLGMSTNIGEIGVWNSNVYGSFESFVRRQIVAGRTSGTINIDASQSTAKVTIGGFVYSLPNAGVLKWDSTHIAVYDSRTATSLNDSSIKKIYAVGYTDEEISDWRNQGKEVIKCG